MIFFNFFKFILFSHLPKKWLLPDFKTEGIDQKDGFVAEWLGRALQKLPQQFESARNLSLADKTKICRFVCFFLF